ncbi:hypothetical protein NE237_011003 [Protea cynaroides]|uniref:TF-B3 domain-containing protein n=1 Tax=Protea cynaroides TaxID=273540 RepID=A0A9Q0L0K8_9MAGN|nr:hypothetical protein NE237_011003 [Protea cynaroides]
MHLEQIPGTSTVTSEENPQILVLEDPDKLKSQSGTPDYLVDRRSLCGGKVRAQAAHAHSFNTCLMWEWEPCTGWSLGRGGQPHRKIHYVFRHSWEGVLAVTETTAVLVWRGRFFGALIRRNHIVCNGLDFYGTTCGQSHSHESKWVRANHRKGGDGDVFFQSGWTDLLKGLPLNKGDILTFQYEGDVILAVTTPHSMTGYEKVGSCGFLVV